MSFRRRCNWVVSGRHCPPPCIFAMAPMRVKQLGQKRASVHLASLTNPLLQQRLVPFLFAIYPCGLRQLLPEGGDSSALLWVTGEAPRKLKRGTGVVGEPVDKVLGCRGYSDFKLHQTFRRGSFCGDEKTRSFSRSFRHPLIRREGLKVKPHQMSNQTVYFVTGTTQVSASYWLAIAYHALTRFRDECRA